jgi:thiamine pyrophosphate-dependent acetolactate synthase large subunit-like protein
VGKGAFQELDQVEAVRGFTKFAGRARSVAEIAPLVGAAVHAALAGRPGAAYVDIPSDVLMAPTSPSEVRAWISDNCKP